MNNILFTTFYTDDNFYTNVYNTYLKPSLKRWKLSSYTMKVSTTGKWATNTFLKPKMIEAFMSGFPNLNIVWLDADATIEQFPQLLFEIPEEYDIGLNWLDWSEHYGRASDKNKFELLDGTIYIKNSPKMFQFIQEWRANTTDKDINHQKPLGDMLAKRDDIKVFFLPREYSYIATTPQGNAPKISLINPVIVHHQKSREAKQYEKLQ